MHTPGSPDVLKIETRPIPTPKAGQVLIRIHAFGINRSEMFTRQGHSPSVQLPRILGIEAAGIVASAPGGEFAPGTTVLTAMGGMGRDFDGGYAEYVLVPARQVQAVRAELAWEVLGAMPEMLQTAWGSLFRALQLRAGDVLLVRGGPTSVGLAAAAIAKRFGATVASTSRSGGREALLRDHGAEYVFVDDGSVVGQVREAFPNGVDKVLELIGVTTLEDSMACVREQGIVCMTGIVGNKWSFDEFNPMVSKNHECDARSKRRTLIDLLQERIPVSVCLTAYSGGPEDFMNTPMQQLAEQIAEGSLKIQIGKKYKLDEIAEAHRVMEANSAGGKIVVLT